MEKIDATPNVFTDLSAGKILIIDLKEIITSFRLALLEEIKRIGTKENFQQTMRFFVDRILPDLQTISCIAKAAAVVRNERIAPHLFAPFFVKENFPPPMMIDSGHIRLMFPNYINVYDKHPDLFNKDLVDNQWPYTGFDSILPKHVALIHRDINHRVAHFQCNVWFPLHDVAENESLVLFPEAYTKPLPSYPKPLNAPVEEWGYGKPYSPSLKFGDAILFHSEHFHCSPEVFRTTHRISVELRVAAACIDDNTQYRRIFANINNFLPTQANGNNSAWQTLNSLMEDFEDTNKIFDHGLRSYQPRLKISTRPQHLLASMEQMENFSFAEDNKIVAARLLQVAGILKEARSQLEMVLEKTNSYFWALEVSYIALQNGCLDLALAALERAKNLVKTSTVKINQFYDLPVHVDRAKCLFPEVAADASAMLSASVIKHSRKLKKQRLTTRHDFRLFIPQEEHVPAITCAMTRVGASHFVCTAGKDRFNPVAAIENLNKSVAIYYQREEVPKFFLKALNNEKVSLSEQIKIIKEKLGLHLKLLWSA